MPRIPTLLRRALDAIHHDAVAGDLLEEYTEHVLPRVGPFRARVWFWKHICKTIAMACIEKVRHARDVRLIGPALATTSRGTPRREIMGTLWNDIRYGIRMLFKNPGISAVSPPISAQSASRQPAATPLTICATAAGSSLLTAI